jgi:hypothetical protein
MSDSNQEPSIWESIDFEKSAKLDNVRIPIELWDTRV